MLLRGEDWKEFPGDTAPTGGVGESKAMCRERQSITHRMGRCGMEAVGLGTKEELGGLMEDR